MMESIITNVFYMLVLVALFGVTIFVHELGHFLVALWSGMVIDTFSIGFGPAIWKKKINGIVYRIGCIPFGGYVALPQLDPAAMAVVQGGQKAEGRRLKTEDKNEKEEETVVREILPVAPWKKVLVSLTGAGGNVLLAIGIAWIVYWIGMPAGPAERSTVVGFVNPESKAYEQGLRIGDEILSVNNVPVKKWSEFRMESALFNEVTLVIKSLEGQGKTITVPTGKGMLGEQTVGGVDGPNLCMVLSVEPGMSAEKVGVKSGDVIVEFAGKEVFSREHLIDLVRQHKDKNVPIKVKRLVEGETALLSMSVTPEVDEKLGMVRIGIRFNTVAIEHDTIIKPLPGDQLKHHAAAIFHFLRALTTPQQAKAASGAVGGPVAILFSYWVIVKTSIMLAVWFTGFLNINLAIINLLPIPVLDGGHIMFSLWEMLTRKPPGARVVNSLVNVFAVLLISLILFLCIRDLDRFTHVGEHISDLFKEKMNKQNEESFLTE